MQMSNAVFLIGRIGKDLELKTTTSGKSVMSFSLAVKDGDKTEWFDIVSWGTTAENIHKYFRKGSKIGISGKLTTNTFETRDGQKRTKVEVLAERFDFVDAPTSETEPGEPSFVEDKDDLPF